MAGLRFTTLQPSGSGNHVVVTGKETRMTTSFKRSFISRVGGLVAHIGSAAAAAGAVQCGRQPRARDLKTLGIDAEQFRSIGRF